MKRLFDIVVAALALVLLLPVFLVLTVAVVMGSPGGAFFRQTRVGQDGRLFLLLKFRSMRPGSEAGGQITVGERDPRITGIGHILRRTKMDELPQLWNVLVGDMSLVGPRPEVPKYVALYTPEQREVLRVRPGLTGPASLAYIDENTLLGQSTDPEATYVQQVMPAKLALDLQYTHEHSFLTDLKILLRTVAKLVDAS